eukprot:CAMPEP_0114588888 /NCGR_PEP_ID=MMETSP0125-20121206/11488_1 /TAXON_ID=485358 ORGANISM="Aristerostoma sp., Strain ATCC 50986" /NCGR_SAMPLE_ID=MMETSP0125 /ASSEMBLY_ACC=CAM_ASM_000245 /LENGTH=569 /DNA_ID=CAMNT_0001785529 /DNA_START=585 /DNA_END=2294 /DNA_ORIENTATION=-
MLTLYTIYDISSDAEYIAYSDFFKNYIEQEKVSRIKIKRVIEDHERKNVAEVFVGGKATKYVVIGDVDKFLETLERTQREMNKTPEYFIPVEFNYTMSDSHGMNRFLKILFTGFMILLAYSIRQNMMSRRGGKGGGMGNPFGDILGMGKTNVRIYGVDNKIKTRFKDVAGLDEAKLEITEFVDFLKKPKKFTELGAKIPRGALLCGPPGTGKTLLAKAAAGEAGVPFLYISGSDFVEMFVGVGASRVRDLFKKAKEHAPSIIFIDEIDAVGRKRESRIRGNDERDNTLNQLLVEMDGFGTDTNVVVLAATNRKELLDPALTRPGRFDRGIDVTLPDIEGRKQIFMVHLKPIKLHPEKTMDEYANRLSTLTPGFSGADIANLCNEAAILAARKNRKFVSSEHFEAASERILGGLEKKRMVSEEERKTVAVHESGHAVVSWFLEGGNPLLKLTIIPRSKGSLGFAQYLPNENSLETKEELMDKICSILGGRCAEQHFNGRVTTGAYDDLRKAYDMASNIVTKFGMSQRVGLIGFEENEYMKTMSNYMQKEIDEEIHRIIAECTDRTQQMVA